MDAICVGIDGSKDRLDIHVRPSRQAFAVCRDGNGLEQLVERLRVLAPQLIAVAATGGFETTVAAVLAGAPLPLVVNPAPVRHFAQAVGKRAKTDPIDAEVIARFAEAVKPEPRAVPDPQARLLAERVARRRQLVDRIVADRNRQKRVEHAPVRNSLARTIQSLEKELSQINGDIDTRVRGSPAWREKEDLLIPFPAVGHTLARTLLAEVSELGELTRRQIASLAGLAPFTRQSGQWNGKSTMAAAARRCAALSPWPLSRRSASILRSKLSIIACSPAVSQNWSPSSPSRASYSLSSTPCSGTKSHGCRSGSGWNSVGVVSVFNLESSGVGAPERRPRHDERYHND